MDAIPERLAVARRLGADETVNFKTDDPVAAILETTDGRGVDVPIEALGTQTTFEAALKVLRPGCDGSRQRTSCRTGSTKTAPFHA